MKEPKTKKYLNQRFFFKILTLLTCIIISFLIVALEININEFMNFDNYFISVVIDLFIGLNNFGFLSILLLLFIFKTFYDYSELHLSDADNLIHMANINNDIKKYISKVNCLNRSIANFEYQYLVDKHNDYLYKEKNKYIKSL